MEFLAYSDDEDDEDGKTTQPAASVETKLQLCLNQKSATSDILAFWEASKALFPRLYALTRKVFCAPASTAGVERLFSIGGYLNSNRRTSLTDSNFEKLLFGHVNFDLCDQMSRKRKLSES